VIVQLNTFDIRGSHLHLVRNHPKKLLTQGYLAGTLSNSNLNYPPQLLYLNGLFLSVSILRCSRSSRSASRNIQHAPKFSLIPSNAKGHVHHSLVTASLCFPRPARSLVHCRAASAPVQLEHAVTVVLAVAHVRTGGLLPCAMTEQSDSLLTSALFYPSFASIPTGPNAQNSKITPTRPMTPSLCHRLTAFRCLGTRISNAPIHRIAKACRQGPPHRTMGP
jgi:hypothetical protein